MVFIAILGIFSFDILAGEKRNEATYNSYNIVPTDGNIEIVLPSGEKTPIHIEDNSNSLATKALASLRHSIYISSRNIASPPDTKSTIYFVGRITGTLPAIRARKNTEGTPERLKFELMGWYIGVPYYEYPQLPPDQDYKWKPIVRHTLEAKDFKDTSVARDVHYDAKHRIYWVGLNPFEK